MSEGPPEDYFSGYDMDFPPSWQGPVPDAQEDITDAEMSERYGGDGGPVPLESPDFQLDQAELESPSELKQLEDQYLNQFDAGPGEYQTDEPSWHPLTTAEAQEQAKADAYVAGWTSLVNEYDQLAKDQDPEETVDLGPGEREAYAPYLAEQAQQSMDFYQSGGTGPLQAPGDLTPERTVDDAQRSRRIAQALTAPAAKTAAPSYADRLAELQLKIADEDLRARQLANELLTSSEPQRALWGRPSHLPPDTSARIPGIKAIGPGVRAGITYDYGPTYNRRK